MIRAQAPASSANLGPGFDAAAAALDLWNEVEVVEGGFDVSIEGEGADELPHDGSHLALQAFATFAPPERFGFRFVNRIPLERGLGSSAAAIGLGLVAGAKAAGREASPDELLGLALRFESHLDNLAAMLLGGVCAAWWDDGEPHGRRLADRMPCDPVVVVPAARTSTHASRASLPATVDHADAAATAGAALLLGAAIASGDPTLLRPALRDRLHEPFRAGGAPLLAEVRAALPARAAGVTLSGSGPSVVAWAPSGEGEALAMELRATLAAGVDVRPLRVAEHGAR